MTLNRKREIRKAIENLIQDGKPLYQIKESLWINWQEGLLVWSELEYANTVLKKIASRNRI